MTTPTPMTTHVVSSHPARSDLGSGQPGQPVPTASPRTPVRSRRWAVAGIGAAVFAIASTTASGLVSAIYDPDLQGDPEGIAAELGDQTAAMLVFHVSTVIAALLMVVFAAGLVRRLRAGLGAEHSDHLAPLIAGAGLVGTAVVLVLGSGLDTEFIFGVKEDDLVNPANAALYNHWIGTVPWCYVLAGLTALAMWSAARVGAVPRWMGRTSLVLGALTLLVGIAPVQYMASLTIQVWMLAITIGFVVGDRAHRSA